MLLVLLRWLVRFYNYAYGACSTWIGIVVTIITIIA